MRESQNAIVRGECKPRCLHGSNLQSLLQLRIGTRMQPRRPVLLVRDLNHRHQQLSRPIRQPATQCGSSPQERDASLKAPFCKYRYHDPSFTSVNFMVSCMSSLVAGHCSLAATPPSKEGTVCSHLSLQGASMTLFIWRKGLLCPLHAIRMTGVMSALQPSTKEVSLLPATIMLPSALSPLREPSVCAQLY
jgi:hypothetical protein